MLLKLLVSYEVEPAKMREYYEFVMRRYLPTMHAMGMEFVEAWATAYGNYPDRLIGFVARDEETVQGLLTNETWLNLNEQLFEYVTDFTYKVIPYREGFQL